MNILKTEVYGDTYGISHDSHSIYRYLCNQRAVLCGTELSFGRYPLEKKIKAINIDSDFLTFPKDTSNLLIANKAQSISTGRT